MRTHPTPQSQAALAALVQASLFEEHAEPGIIEDVLTHLLDNKLITQEEQDKLWCEEQSYEHGVLDLFMDNVCLRIEPNGNIEEIAL